MNFKKILSVSLGATILFSLGGVLAVGAQGYVPLVSLPGVTEAGTAVNMSSYLSGMIKLLIALASGLAVLMLIIGGTQYVASGVLPDQKSDAKERMKGAIGGLVLILVSYLILNSINPKLVQFHLMLPPIGVLPSSTAVVATTTPAVAPSGVAWPSDSAIRKQLLDAGVAVKSPACTIEKQSDPCTSVTGLGQGAIDGLSILKSSCSACSIVVTGGTEYWAHSENTAHRPGNSVVDLRLSTSLNSKIQSGTSLGVQSSCSSLGKAWRYLGKMYVLEGDHWHVCY